MKLGMAMRLWARQAPRSHVVATVVAFGVVLALLVVVAVPDDESSTVEAAPGPIDLPGGSQLGLTTGTSTPEAGPGDAGVTADAASPGSVGGLGPSAGPAAAGPGGQGSEASEAGGGAGSEALTASDRGITADTIKIGFIYSKGVAVDAAGFVVDNRQDLDQVVKAYVDSVNKAGGVNGRKLVHVTATSDPTDSSTWRPACIKVTEDEKVFSAMTGSGVLGATHFCFVERETHIITGVPTTLTASQFRAGGGYIVSEGANGNRNLLNWASIMLNSGAIGPGKGKLGLFTDDCPETREVFNKELKPYLKEQGVDFLEVAVSCDFRDAQAQTPGAVLQMRQAGVNRVFLATIFSTVQGFLSNAQAQQWRPAEGYSVTDYAGQMFDILTRNYPPEQFDGTQGHGFGRYGQEAAGLPHPPVTQHCSKVLEEAGLDPIREIGGRDIEANALCGAFFNVWINAMKRTPVNPTRTDWIAAVQTLPPLEGSYVSDVKLGRGKFDGGDSYGTAEWRRECQCWVQIRPHEPAQF